MDVAISELVKGQQLITVSTDQTVADVLDILSQNNITSAPVYEGGKPIGFLDILDLLAFLISTCTKPLTTRETAESTYLNTDDQRMLKKRAKDFQVAHVYELIGKAQRSPWVTLKKDDIVEDAVIALAKNKVHRVGVMDNNNNLVGILTQSMVVRQLEEFLTKHNTLKDVRAADIKMTPVDNMVLVGPQCPVIDALMTMHKNRVSAVAIIEGRQLLGNLSASDLKSPYIRDFNNLLEPVLHWLKQSHKAMKKSETYLVTCTQDTYLPDMIQRINRERVHRIFIVDHTARQGDVLGVISLTDILDSIASRRLVS